MFDRDQFNSADPTEVGRVSIGIADIVQRHRAPEAILGSAYFFLLLCTKHKVEPQDAFVVLKNILAHREGQQDPALIAASMYVENDL